MKLLTLGIVAGLALAVVVRHAAIRYSQHGLPPTYEGPRFYQWHDSVAEKRLAWADDDAPDPTRIRAGAGKAA